MKPLSSRAKPIRQRNKLVFPHPDSPTIQAIAPALSVNDKSANKFFSPALKQAFFTSNISFFANMDAKVQQHFVNAKFPGLKNHYPY